MNKVYACIDLKSFYASVECVERNLDPIITNLVVADKTRTEKTICLAVTPSLKQYGLSGRSRLYEVYQKVKQVNRERRSKIKNDFTNKSFNDIELKKDNNLELDFIIAPPRMKMYMKYSTKIYGIYLKYLAPEDIYVYSVDEVFLDVTNYLKMYKLTAEELVTKMILDVYKTTGITATGGIGTNMYLAKIAMDIVAKHIDANKEGVRIAYLDEMKYRKELWNHKPLSDFWRVGSKTEKRLAKYNIFTMGDIAKASIKYEDFLYKIFGINAELLIDHAWGWEPTTIKDVKSYKPLDNSLSNGQVLHIPYEYDKTKLIVKEMIELLTLDMIEKHLATNQIVLTIGYDIENLDKGYDGEIVKDHYGRPVPKPSHGTIRLENHSQSIKLIKEKTLELFERIINKELLTRRITIAVCNLKNEKYITNTNVYKQFDLFSNNEREDEINQKRKIDEEKEKQIGKAVLNIKNKYGKNSILKAMNLEEGGRAIERNSEVGGHRG